MKKLLLSIAVVASAMTINAQGTWTAITPDPTPGATIPVDTELGFKITGLTVQNTASEGVTEKSDLTAPDDGSFTNKGILQANASNATYYAFKVVSNGILKVAAKYGAAKPLFVYELAETDLAVAAASGNVISSGYGTDVNVSLSNGATFTEGMTFAATTYTTLTFNVTAGKIYAVGVTGSKFQLRGVNYALTSGISSTKNNAQIVATEYYSVTGAKLTVPVKGSLNIVKHKMSDGSIVSSKIYLNK